MSHSTLHFATGLVIGTIGGLPWIWCRIIARQPVAHIMKRWILISWTLAFIAIFPNLLGQVGVSENIVSTSWMNVFLFHTVIARLDAGGIVRGGICIIFCFVLQYSFILIAINRVRRYLPQYQPTVKLMILVLCLLPAYEQCSASEYYVVTNGSYEIVSINGLNAYAETYVFNSTTKAHGQVNISGNNVCVGGTTSGSEPSRRIWIKADWSPWDTTNYMTATDHQVISNNVTSAIIPSGSIGMHHSYRMTTPPYDNNNGIRATVINNTICSFATGIIMESGTEGVRFPHIPLMEVIIRTNQLYGNTYC